MSKVSIPVGFCRNGDILADDVVDSAGKTIVCKDTVINSYIINLLTGKKIPNVWLLQPAELLLDSKDTAEKSVNVHKKNVYKIKTVLNKLSLGQKVDYNDVAEITDSIYNFDYNSSEMTKCLILIRNADSYTYTHSINVALYSMKIANWLGLPKRNVEEIIQAGFLHDIGKARISDSIINKKGALSKSELELMGKHPIFGYEMVKDNPRLPEEVKRAILQHHERLDGSGYPYSLRGNEISLYAKIISIADVFDAMTQNRIYKEKVSPFEAFQMLHSQSNESFDKNITDTFLTHLSAHYVGVDVLLNNGAHGMVVYVPPDDVTNPIVRLGSTYINFFEETELKIVSIL